ncbi:MAG: hypothetical protein OXP36_09700 [Gammaproteobacteria bacterium]|nr:hypothetical protein [Gammaproteobacteria bacterium]
MDHAKNDGKDFFFTVNGVELYSEFEKLVALDILKIAKKKNAIPGKPEDYILKGDTRQYKLDDWVDLSDDKALITLPQGATPVA